MNDDANGKILPPPWQKKTRERELSGIQPFFSLRYRRRGRSISRIVVLRKGTQDDTAPQELELFFGLG
jgi:hypothetical protein